MNEFRYHDPPKVASWFLRYLFPDDGEFTTAGDLEEAYHEILEERGTFFAHVWYWIQIFKTVPPLVKNSIDLGLSFIGNYAKIAYRNMKKSKVYTFINVSGLSIGIACSILIFFFIQSEINFDSFHENADEIYRVSFAIEDSNGKFERFVGSVPQPLVKVLQNEFPEIKQGANYYGERRTLKFKDKVSKEELHFVDRKFLDVFSFPLVFGSKGTALSRQKSIVVSTRIMREYFGNKNPVGETVSLKYRNDYIDYTITGVLDALPNNSSLKFDFLLPVDNLQLIRSTNFFNDWNDLFITTFVQLYPGTDVHELVDRLPNFEKKYAIEPNILLDQGNRFSGDLRFVPLTEMHYTPNVALNDNEFESKPMYIYILAGITLLVLIVACINLMNLTICQSVKRAREVGMRKVFGAKKTQLIKQFLTETIFISLISLTIGILLAELFMPLFNSALNINLKISYFSNAAPLAFLATLIFSVGVFAGIYPAIVLSDFRPVSVLKNLINIRGKNLFTKSLILAQFSVSIMLIICSAIMFSQIRYLSNMDLGFENENIVEIDSGIMNSQRSFELYKEQILQNNNILKVCGSVGNPYSVMPYLQLQTKTPQYLLPVLLVDTDYFETLDIRLVHGRNFSKGSSYDYSNSMIVNEKYLEEFSINDPIGQRSGLTGDFDREIIGVVKNFHYQEFDREIEPMVIILNGQTGPSKINVKISSDNISETVSFLENKWREIIPGEAFVFNFMDDKIQSKYESNKNWAKVIGFATFFAFLIASLGLFGVTSISITKRTKEIGVRKVLGASVMELINVCNKEFIALVILSNLLSWPLSYYIMKLWLTGFAYRIPLNLNIFIFTALTVTFLSMIPIVFQTTKAAATNPIKILKKE